MQSSTRESFQRESVKNNSSSKKDKKTIKNGTNSLKSFTNAKLNSINISSELEDFSFAPFTRRGGLGS